VARRVGSDGCPRAGEGGSVKVHRLLNTGVRHLEYLFSPPGLPLVAKGGGAVETTAVLVRGPAGAGKTTLALAIASALAKRAEGSVYFLATEALPEDVWWKGTQAGFADDAMQDARTPREGAFLHVDHVAAHDAPDGEPPEERARRALRLAWSWAEVNAERVGLRAVVIDAFAVVGERGSADDRADVLQFLQGLEAKGITPVLVEEVGSHEWTAYLVDVVLELSWGEDPDTGGRTRKLACSKSRYATGRYGPHDYGREIHELAVWPTFASVVSQWRWPDNAGGARVLELILPASVSGPMLVAPPGQLTGIALTGRPSLTGLLHRLPWLGVRGVNLGAVGSVERGFRVPVEEGPGALAWAIVDAVLLGAGAVVVDGLRFALDRRRYRSALLDELEAITLLGVAVFLCEDTPVLDDLPRSLGAKFSPSTSSYGEAFVAKGDPLLSLLASSPEAPEDQLLRSAVALSAGDDRAALLTYTALHAVYTASDAPLDWLLALTDAAERRTVAPYVTSALVRRGRTDEAGVWLAEALTGNLVSPDLRADVDAAIAELSPR